MPAKGKGKAVAHDEQPMEVDNGEGMSAGALIKKHQAKMAWSMAGWHGGATLYHPQGCQKCCECRIILVCISIKCTK